MIIIGKQYFVNQMLRACVSRMLFAYSFKSEPENTLRYFLTRHAPGKSVMPQTSKLEPLFMSFFDVFSLITSFCDRIFSLQSNTFFRQCVSLRSTTAICGTIANIESPVYYSSAFGLESIN